MKRYIDANKAKEVFHYKTGGSSFDDFINDVPTEDVVEVRYGEWIKYCTGLYGSNYKCSKCGNLADEDNSGHYAIFTNYCSNCGAKMNGGNK